MKQQIVDSCVVPSQATIGSIELHSCHAPFLTLLRNVAVLLLQRNSIQTVPMTSEQATKRRIGELVTEATAELGLSRNELAKRAGVAVGTLYMLEAGKSWPQSATRRKITDALGWRPRAVQQLLDSERDPAGITLDDVRADAWDARPTPISDITDEALLAELTMRMQLKNQQLRKLQERDNVVPFGRPFDESMPHAAHPDMERDADRYPVDLGEEPQD